MADIMCGMIIQLTFVRSTDRIIFVGTGKRDSVDLRPVFFRYVFSQVTVKQDQEKTQELQITVRRYDLTYLIDKNLFLVMEQIFCQFPESNSPFGRIPLQRHFPQPAFALPQMIRAIRTQTICLYQRISRQRLSVDNRLFHICRQIKDRGNDQDQSDKTENGQDQVFYYLLYFHIRHLLFSGPDIPTLTVPHKSALKSTLPLKHHVHSSFVRSGTN